MSISERIFDIMKAKKLSQGELANALHIRQATVSSWKTKATTPAATLLEDIANFLGVSVNYLVTGKEANATAAINQGVFGNENHHNTVTIHGQEQEMSELDAELLRICQNLNIREKNTLLTFAYELESKVNKGV